LNKTLSDKPLVAIACGGTGGHLYPGLAIAEKLVERRADVLLLISAKEIDQQAVKSAIGMQAVALPAVGLTRGHVLEFSRGFFASYRAAKERFRVRPPQAVLAMGGFTSAPPVFAGRSLGAVTFLHESNIIPGRANRLLAHFVDQAFVGFSTAAGRLFSTNIVTTGTPVRPQFEATDPASCRMALRLAPERPVLLVMGGSQGAAGINELAVQALPELVERIPAVQILHISGISEQAKVEAGYAGLNVRAVIRPFLTEMELALGAASVAISRAGASSLAELAAMRVPSILIPYPAAADKHQFHNGKAFADAGAALLVEQKAATAKRLVELATTLFQDRDVAERMRERLKELHAPHAAEMIAEKIMLMTEARGGWKMRPQKSNSDGVSGLHHSQALGT